MNLNYLFKYFFPALKRPSNFRKESCRICFIVCWNIFLSINCLSQNENSKWVFSQGAGLDFMTNPPTVATYSNFLSHAGCASVADAGGNLLFYTDGSTIYNQSQQIMANGSGLFGYSGASQSALIVKKPGSASLYYVFTHGLFPLGLHYSIVDMSLAAGMGSVTVLNVPVLGVFGTEKLTGTLHCNGRDFWIVTHTMNSNNFCSFLLSSSGLNTSPIVSATGATYTNSTSFWYGMAGSIEISPNGKKLGAAIQNDNAPFFNPAVFELFDFDNSTGIVSNPIALINHLALISNISKAFSCEFSPDGTKFYGSCRNLNTIHTIYQWDLCTPTGTANIPSLYTYTWTDIPNLALGNMQLAPNGKIYIGRVSNTSSQTSLCVINNPNLVGSAFNFVPTGQSIALNLSNGSLPNFMNSSLIPHPAPSPFTHTVNSALCQSASFTAPPLLNTMTVTACSVNGYSLTNLLWNFGDPASGATNASTLNNPVHIFSSQGNFTVQLILYYSCTGGTDTLTQVVNINQPCIAVNSTSITCANLGSATVTPLSGTPPYTYTWIPSNQTNSIATGLSPGTYTIKVFDPANNYTYSTTTIFTSLIPLTGSLNISPSITCNGASTGTAYYTNFAGGSGNQNYLWSNGINTYTVPNPINLSAGTWSVTVTDALTGCQVFSVFTITQPPASTLSLASSVFSTCVGSDILLTGTNSGGTAGYTYTWTNGSSLDTHTVNEITSGTYVYTLNSSDANNCLTSNTISVDFIPTPTLTVSDASICPLQIGTLTISGATSYTWASTSLSLTGITFTDSPSATQQYSVTGSALGCTSIATASIVLKPTPFATLVDNSPLCEGASLNLTAYGGVSNVWTGANGFSSVAQSNTLNSVALNQAGIYNLTVTAANSCTAAATKTIVIHPTPTVSATGATICTSQTLNLSANSNATGFLWTGPQSFTSNVQNPSIASPALGHTGTYSIIATSVFGCTNSAITTASVIDPPSLTVVLSSPSLCSQAFNGSPNTLTLTAGGASIYSLVTVPDMSIFNPNGPVSQLTAIPPNTGIASATLSGSNGVCTVTTGLTFSIIPNPTVTISSPTPVICAGETYTYTNQGANSYTWSSATPGFTTYNNGGVAVANPSINSVFSVFGGSLGCNSASQTSSITVNPLPTFIIGPQNPTVCIGSKVNLTAGGTANSYSWAPYATLNSENGSTVSVNPTSQQTYTVIGSLNSCTSTAMITVSILSLPSPTIHVSNPKVCLNEAITMQGFGGEYYKWTGPNSVFYQGQTISFKAGSPSYAGSYTLTATDENGCEAKTNTEITVYNLPSGSLQGKMEGCVPLHSEFNFQSTPDINVVWELNQKLFTEKNFTKEFTIPGTYTITGRYTDTLTHCKNTNSFEVNVHPVPIADFTFLPEKPIENLDQVIFTNTSKGEEQTNWNWYFINNKGYISENKNTSYLFTEAGTYPVAMVVTNTWGCQDTLIKSVKVEADLSVYVPNVFTPNDDYLNDVFLPITRGIKFYELLIFDRWGAKVFSTTKVEEGWDGTYRGEACKVDVYVWKINLSSVNGEMKTMTGSVTLSR